MADEASGNSFQLELRRTFPTAREPVYDAWTRREALERWMCHEADIATVRYLDLDVRPGGGFRLEVTRYEEHYLVFGAFRELKSPEQLVFTWAWERTQPNPGDSTSDGETVVTVDLVNRDDATEVRLTQGVYPTAKRRDDDLYGWETAFAALKRYLEPEPPH